MVSRVAAGAASSADYAASLDPTMSWEKRRYRKGCILDVIEPDHGQNACPDNHCRWVTISDTHGKHRALTDNNMLPDGDVLIHAGDLTNAGEVRQIRDFCEWMSELTQYKHKIVIAGNHDLTLDEESYYPKHCKRFHFGKRYKDVEARHLMRTCPHFTYLEDATAEDVFGYRVYGSPWQPEFCDWAFNLERGAPCDKMWDKIPSDTDILVTHGPPLGHGDLCLPGNKRAGCLDLLNQIENRIKPLVHVFGHVHEGYGVTSNRVTKFINASTCTLRYRPMNKPIVFDLPLLAKPVE